MKAVLVKSICASGEFLAPESTVDLSEAEFVRLESMGVVRAAEAVDIFLAGEPEPEKPKRGRKVAETAAPVTTSVTTPATEPEDL